MRSPGQSLSSGIGILARKLVHADVGARIALIRRRLGLTRYEFAERLGAPPAPQGNWEMGQMPRAHLLDRLARSGGVSVEWLLHGHDSGGKQAVRPRGPKNVLHRKVLNREKPSESYMLADFAPAALRKLPRGYLERYQSRA